MHLQTVFLNLTSLYGNVALITTHRSINFQSPYKLGWVTLSLIRRSLNWNPKFHSSHLHLVDLPNTTFAVQFTDFLVHASILLLVAQCSRSECLVLLYFGALRCRCWTKTVTTAAFHSISEMNHVHDRLNASPAMPVVTGSCLARKYQLTCGGVEHRSLLRQTRCMRVDTFCDVPVNIDTACRSFLSWILKCAFRYLLLVTTGSPMVFSPAVNTAVRNGIVSVLQVSLPSVNNHYSNVIE